MQVLCPVEYYGSIGGVVLQPKLAENRKNYTSEESVIIAQRRTDRLLANELNRYQQCRVSQKKMFEDHFIHFITNINFNQECPNVCM